MPTIKAKRVSHPASWCSLQLEPCFISQGCNTPGAKATGFLWRSQSGLWLISNLHVFSGWNHIKDVALSANKLIPNWIRAQVWYGKLDSKGDLETQDATLELPLQSDSTGSTAYWLVHPQLGSRVDLAAYPLPSKFHTAACFDSSRADWKLASVPVNDLSPEFDFQEAAADDAFVIGFPKGLHGGGGFPIWKRASIASEPDFSPDDDLPKLYIDGATREGMSGSPVLARKIGRIDLPDGSHRIGQYTKFLGVYSGRYAEDDPFGASIGVVWKGHLIDEIIHGGAPGNGKW